MKRGEIWTASGGSDYAGKPRPAVVVQDSELGKDILSVTICFFTSSTLGPSLVRPEVAPSETNGLRLPSRLMADKITTIPNFKLGDHIGQLADEDITRLNRAMIVFLGLAASSQGRS